MCASRNIVNTISCTVFDTFSPKLRQLWDRDERFTIWVKRSKIKVTVEKHTLEPSLHRGGIQYSTSHVELDFLVFAGIGFVALKLWLGPGIEFCFNIYLNILTFI